YVLLRLTWQLGAQDSSTLFDLSDMSARIPAVFRQPGAKADAERRQVMCVTWLILLKSLISSIIRRAFKLRIVDDSAGGASAALMACGIRRTPIFVPPLLALVQADPSVMVRAAAAAALAHYVAAGRVGTDAAAHLPGPMWKCVVGRV
ncbi:MAG: hypothetical protein M5U34_35755, partial [Chloroflexi bacterium]|nr:hypothetical protein [Chloroflexota bacterium]